MSRPESFSRLATCLALFALGCEPSPAPTDAASDPVDAGPPPADAGPPVDAFRRPTEMMIGTTERPARLLLPPAHDETTALPLLVLLHGYSVNAMVQDLYFGTSRLARERGFYLVLADGTEDAAGNRFWNAGACCDFGGRDIDDVGYLTGLLDDAEAAVPVDTSRVYFVGHSNGAFMSYRMACEIPERITAIAPLAGNEAEMSGCMPSVPVSVLHMHGTADETIAYTGGTVSTIPYLSVDDTVAAWVERDGCDPMPVSGGTADYDMAVDGAETMISRHERCTGGALVELWRMEGSGHIPGLGGATGAGPQAMIDWLLARRRM